MYAEKVYKKIKNRKNTIKTNELERNEVKNQNSRSRQRIFLST